MSHWARPARAASACSTSLLSGAYGGYGFGSIDSGKVNFVYFFNFDGAGNFEITEGDEMANGKFEQNSNYGTYTALTLANGECKISLQPSQGGESAILASPAGSGSELFMLPTTSNFNVSIVLTKQQITSCDDSVLSGQYGGYTFGQDGGYINNGVVYYKFDGVGDYQLTENDFMSNGVFGSASNFGTYTTTLLSNGECRAKLVPSENSQAPIYAAPVDGGSEIYMLPTTSGLNFSQVLKKQ